MKIVMNLVIPLTQSWTLYGKVSGVHLNVFSLKSDCEHTTHQSVKTQTKQKVRLNLILFLYCLRG
jgi:hypothetical protein